MKKIVITLAAIDRQHADTDRKREPARSRRSRVHDQDVSAVTRQRRQQRLVRVTVHDDVCGAVSVGIGQPLWAGPTEFMAVAHAQLPRSNRYRADRGKSRVVRVVSVAVDGDDGRDRSELIEHRHSQIGRAHV